MFYREQTYFVLLNTVFSEVHADTEIISGETALYIKMVLGNVCEIEGINSASNGLSIFLSA